LINQIITELKLPLKSSNRSTPALSTKILQWNGKAPDFDQQDMRWKNQQVEMKNKGAPERDGKGKRSRETWRVRVDHGK
jgi:hypothetical protein